MKALSIQQPWAERILNGSKLREYRTWSTSFRGLLLVHAGKVVDQEALEEGEVATDFQRGALLGIVEVVGMERPSIFAWVLQNPRRLPSPVPWKGALGLFEVDPAQVPGLAGLL